MTPSAQLHTHYDHVFVVGKTNASIINIDLNGRRIDEIVVEDSIFHSLVKFGYGLNKISITPVVNGSPRVSDSEAIDILSAPKIPGKYEKYFDDYNFHGDLSRKECINCHKCKSSNPELAETDQFCLNCHTVINQRFKSHIADTDKSCVICHKLTPDLRLTLSGAFVDKNPCYECHKDKIGQFARDYVHGPVAGGSCSICHDPHGSEFDNNLLYPTEILCQTCHNNLNEAKLLRVQHPPFSTGQCNKCHDPHSTNYKWVLVKKSQDVCVGCHITNGEFEAHDHPYNVKPKRALQSSLELTKEGQLECLSCHNPHASDSEHLLRTTQESICQGCHPNK